MHSITKNVVSFSSTLTILLFCINALAENTDPKRIVVWDGEQEKTGAGWVNPTRSILQPQTKISHSGNTALAFSFEGNNEWIGAGWTWTNFKTGEDVGTDISKMKTLSFWIRTEGKPVEFKLNLMCNGEVLDTPEHHSNRIHVIDYAPQVFNGQWQEVRIPLSHLVNSKGFNQKNVSLLQLDLNIGSDIKNTFYIDDIAFDSN